MTMTMTAAPAARRGEWQGYVAVVALAAALAFPLVVADGGPVYLLSRSTEAILASLFLVFAALAGLDRTRSGVGSLLIKRGDGGRKLAR